MPVTHEVTPRVDLTTRAYQANEHGSFKFFYPRVFGSSLALIHCYFMGGNHLHARTVWGFTLGWDCRKG